MPFAPSPNKKAPPQFQGGLYVRRNGEDPVIAGETTWSERLGLHIGQPIGKPPKSIPIFYEEPESR